MHICLVSEEFPIETQKGGIATYQYIMAKTLFELGHVVHVICKTHCKTDRVEVHEGITLHYVSYSSMGTDYERNVIYRKKVCQQMKELEDQIDIFEVADWGAESHYYLPIRKKPVVIKLHTPYFVWNEYNNTKSSKKNKMLQKHEIEDILKCDNIYSCSHSLANIVNETIPNLNTVIKVINNPVFINELIISKDIIKEKHILYIGSLEQRKGVLKLAKELNFFFRDVTDYKVIFTGADSNRNEFGISTKRMIENIVDVEHHDKIIFTGQLPHKEITSLLEKATVSIFPSLYENFPYVLLESINEECLNIGSENGGMAEIIDENSGLLCNPYIMGDICKKLKEAITMGNEERLKLTKTAKSHLIQFERFTIAEKTVEFYKTTLKK
ncbi:glycosyltransferase involved in cell wall biosynthesis [Enterococcus rotai]|uniref:Glycosyl transferase family 1 n=1 Tax=Enterococcus rotai TaxID=118060 RepID=A0A0U2XB87_9ENTE|nr:glycosyltransferase family 4 protein [Enterococcus rotai]ALS36065.1 hypothetical protein ATZ35_02480 [Enterococcus rotai]